MSAFITDCRHALRLYVRTPGASLIAILALAIGMAFVGAFLSLYVDLVLRPHPGFEQSNRIATVGQNTGTNLVGITYEMVERIRADMNSVESAAMFMNTRVMIDSGQEPEQIMSSLVSEGFFRGLRPRLALGQGFTDAAHEPDAEPVVVLSYRYWLEAFNGDRDVIDRHIDIARPESTDFRIAAFGSTSDEDEDAERSARFRIVGVMAESLPGIFVPAGGSANQPDVWLPLERAWPLLGGLPDRLPRLQPDGTIVRVADGASVAAVTNELRARYDDQPALWVAQPGAQLDAIGGIVDNSVVHRDAKRQLEMFLAGSLLLAIVATANVSLFLLARAPGRRRELGIRMAVGAPVRRLARQLATEAGLLVVAAAVLGLLFSIWLSLYLRSLAFLRAAEWNHVTLLDWRVLGLAGVVVLVLSLLVSLAPMLGLKRIGIAAASRQVAARASLTQRIAGSAQIAVAGTLGSAAIAFGLYLGVMLFGDPGYAVRDRYSLQISLDISSLINENGTISLDSLVVRNVRAQEIIEAQPGISAISFSSLVPAAQSTLSIQEVPDPTNPAETIGLTVGTIDSGFVDVLDLRLRHGRAPEDTETGVALVNESLARRFFGRDNVVGESLEIRSVAGSTLRIVGVLEDLSFAHPAADVNPIAFMQVPSNSFAFRAIVQSALTPADLQQTLRALIESGELEVLRADVQPLKTLRTNLLAADTARGLLTIATAGLVVLLATIGFYGTQTYLVTAGRREYAIRAALGAGPRALRRLVLMRGLVMGLPGLVVGSLLGFIAVAWLRDHYVTRAVSPATISLLVVIGLCTLLLAASFAPARRAMRTQPASVLRQD